MITKSYCWKKTAVAVAAVALLGLGTGSASALSLGSMTVHSALGEPLRAEIDVTSISSEEVNSVTMRIAPPDAFVAAGLEYNSVLKNTLVTLQRRPNGQPYIRVSSSIPINDPYVDLILEANSSSGRVARDYPMLFDPPVRSQAANNVAANRPTLAQVPMDDFDSYPSYPSPAQATPSYATAWLASSYRIPIIDDSPRTANNSTASNVTGVTNGGVTSRNISETSPAAATGGATTVAAADEFPEFPQNTSDPVNVNMPPARNARQPSSKVRSGSSSVVRSKSHAIARLRHPSRVQTAAPKSAETTTTASTIEVSNPSAGASSVVVKPGDTATKIAAALKPANVSLDDMLAALLRANPDAFVKNDVNRMRIGAVLKVPDASAIASGSGNAAGNNPTQSLTAESKNFNEYRRNLATQSPQTATEEAGRKAAGKIETKVDDKTASTTTPDKLTLSKGAVQGKSAEATIANERATKETATRAAEMNKNIADLQKLGASGAIGAIRPASAANPASAATSAARPASAVASATASAASAASAIASAARLPASHASAAVSASVVASAASSAVSAAPAASAALATASMPTVTASSTTALASAASTASAAAANKRPSLTPPVPLEPPGLLDQVLGEDYLLPLLGGGGALLAGLGGLAFWRSRKRKKEMVAEESSFIESRIPSDSFFGASGGQNVDTSQEEEHANSSAMIYSPSQLNAIDDVDPVAEADVYLAYGRDVQAEEILREALLTNPGRVAIHTKLLEILAKRQDVEAFEAAVSQVSQVVKKDSPDWAHICELGQSVDPANPMYQVGRPANSGAGMQMFTSAAPAASTADEPMASSLSHATAVMPDVDLDLDLDFDDEEEETSTAVPPSPVAPAPAPASHSNSLNMDLDAALDMDFDLSTPIEPAPAPAPASAPEAALEHLATQSLEEMFNLNFDEPPNAFALPNANTSKAAAPKPAAIPAKSDGDGMLLEFNLDDFQLPGSTPTPVAMGARLEDPLETKLALAQEFVSIGDEFGAREILEEVIAGASGELQAKARAALAKLG